MDTKSNYTANPKRTVLIVDDEYVNRELLGHILQSEYKILYAENGREALDIIRDSSKILSLILLDIIMPEMNGFEVLKIIKSDEELKKIPVIVLTSEVSAELQSLKLGAADFIKKPYDMPEIIIARAKRIVELSEDKIIIQSTERDILTGLYTKDFFLEYSRLMEKFHPDNNMDAVVIYIEHFQLIDELYGKVYGEKILKHVGDSIKKLLEEINGIGCRVEDNMFYIYCMKQENYEQIHSKIVSGLPEIFDIPNSRLKMGVCPKENYNADIEKRFDKAKVACETIMKEYTKNIAFYDHSLYERDKYYERLIHDMREALENHDFKIYYQPKYKIDGEKPVLCSAEALVRWVHPKLGLINPCDFIPLFENNGLIQLLDRYVWAESGRQIKEWKKKFNISIPISINVSRIDIYDPNIKNNLLDVLEENGLSVEDLYLEITESVYAEDASRMIKVIENLRNTGFIIEMDDFGSGYSSLNMLNNVPIDALKLDIKFVKNMHTDKKSLRLVQLIIDIARSLSVPVIAEGVELEQQYKLLKKLGCDVIQGFYFSKPVPPEEFEKFIEEKLQK